MTGQRVTLLGALAIAAVVAASCGEPVGSTAAPATQDAAPATSAPAAPSTVAPTPEPTTLRDGDVTDVAELATSMAAGAQGDPEWIDVFAALRAESWLLTRYPGRYEIADTYADLWAAQTVIPNEEELIGLGVYLDEPLPRLVSVEMTRELGQVIELEVVIEAGVAVVRHEADDRRRSELAGGTTRGLFTIAPDGPEGRWRIHSVVELRILDDNEESNP